MILPQIQKWLTPYLHKKTRKTSTGETQTHNSTL